MRYEDVRREKRWRVGEESEGGKKSSKQRGKVVVLRSVRLSAFSPLWGGGPSALRVCHSTRLCLAPRER